MVLDLDFFIELDSLIFFFFTEFCLELDLLFEYVLFLIGLIFADLIIFIPNNVLVLTFGFVEDFRLPKLVCSFLFEPSYELTEQHFGFTCDTYSIKT